jgi:hypothetical protein
MFVVYFSPVFSFLVFWLEGFKTFFVYYFPACATDQATTLLVFPVNLPVFTTMWQPRRYPCPNVFKNVFIHDFSTGLYFA